MREWLAGLVEPQYVDAVLWTLGALAALFIVLLLIKLARGFKGGTFVAGGRNRKTRLAVMDATAIDTHRRLVLVRRDDVEHLLLIGGPTDVVVEQDIRILERRRQPPREPLPDFDPPSGPAPEPSRPHEVAVQVQRAAASRGIAAPEQRGNSTASAVGPRHAPAEVKLVTEPRPNALQPRPAAEHGPAAEMRIEPRGLQPRPEPQRVESPRPAEPRPAPAPLRMAPPPKPPTSHQPVRDEDVDEALLKELEVSFDEVDAAPAPRPSSSTAVSLDDEMTRLLGELSNRRR